MSLQNSFLKLVQSPHVVAGVGTTLLATMPLITSTIVSGGWSMTALQLLNLTAFATNVVTVSIPGRIDGENDNNMRRGLVSNNNNNNNTSSSSSSTDDDKVNKERSSTSTYTDVYSPDKGRSLVTPSGWAFSIWGPIYLGEAYFCLYGQFVHVPDVVQLAAITAPFTIACIFQSLWCASFRPSYFANNNNNPQQQQQSQYWTRFISVGMLGGTAYSLFQLNNVCITYPELTIVLVPMILHSGWTTAATLVNLNGSIASITKDIPDSVVIGAGHASVVLATFLGCYYGGVKLSPVYTSTIAWALLACSTGMRKKKASSEHHSEKIVKAMNIQQRLCEIGTITCIYNVVYIAIELLVNIKRRTNKNNYNQAFLRRIKKI